MLSAVPETTRPTSYAQLVREVVEEVLEAEGKRAADADEVEAEESGEAGVVAADEKHAIHTCTTRTAACHAG